jgi:hypothetical protein
MLIRSRIASRGWAKEYDLSDLLAGCATGQDLSHRWVGMSARPFVWVGASEERVQTITRPGEVGSAVGSTLTRARLQYPSHNTACGDG